MQALYKNVRCSVVPLPRCRPCFFACAMHLEMASSLPAAEDCDVQGAAESAARRAIKTILPIFMLPSPLLRRLARATTGHAAALPSPAMNSRRRIGHASSRFTGSLSRLWMQGNGGKHCAIPSHHD